MTDQQLLLTALQDAGRVVAEYLEPDHAMPTRQFKIDIDRQDLAAATRRMENGHGLRLMK
jgi:hypothetical protein